MKGSILLQCLTSGKPTSVRHLADVCKRPDKEIESTRDRLIEMGLPIVRTTPDVMKLSFAVVPLEPEQISKAVLEFDVDLANRIEFFDEIDSTNQYLMKLPLSQLQHKQICLAEYMTEGRGRRRRKWHSGAYQNVILSMAWQFESPSSQLTGLSLAVAVMIVHCLKSMTDAPFKLKWPNDILVHNRKLSGILIEIREGFVIIGIGINCNMTSAQRKAIDQPVTSLDVLLEQEVNRNLLIPRLLFELTQGLEKYFDIGFEPFREQWVRLHAFQGKRVRIDGTPVREGFAQGIDNSGALTIKLDTGEVMSIHSGDVRAVS